MLVAFSSRFHAFLCPVGTAESGADDAPMQAAYTYDAMGRLTYQMDYAADGVSVVFNRGGDAAHGNRITYDQAGRILHELDLTLPSNGIAVTSSITNEYGTGTSGYALGALLSSSVVTSSGAAPTKTATTTNTIGWYGGAVTTAIAHTPDTAQPGTVYTTAYAYTPGGTLRTATITDGRPRTVTVRSDALGQAIRRDEADDDTVKGDPHALWYRFDGREIGTIGTDVPIRPAPGTGDKAGSDFSRGALDDPRRAETAWAFALAGHRLGPVSGTTSFALTRDAARPGLPDLPITPTVPACPGGSV